VLWLTEQDKELMKQILSFDILDYSKPSNPVLTPGDKQNCISTLTAVQSSLKTDTVSTTTASCKIYYRKKQNYISLYTNR
jgi:hypothetical protein